MRDSQHVRGEGQNVGIVVVRDMARFVPNRCHTPMTSENIGRDTEAHSASSATHSIGLIALL